MISQLVSLLFLFQAAFAIYSNSSGVVTTSEVVLTSTFYGTVTVLTTYCPLSTDIVTNGKTYSVTAATTLTITDCPCVQLSTSTYTQTVLCSSGTTFSTLTSSGATTPAATTSPAGAEAVSGVAETTSPASVAPASTTASVAAQGSGTSTSAPGVAVTAAENKGEMMKAPSVFAGAAILIACLI